ncbi:type II toxin-antitoxin system RelE/ParE family toxin [Patescibacteria group bacterium]|nr:type II toxin-antitoxin system RelE/ParE family toxin [Patescibacteria group bacterium]
MLKIDIGKRAEKYLRTLPKKHAQQVILTLYELQKNPSPPDSKQLKNSTFRRADMGEHRIIYCVVGSTLFIPLIGKRNDNDVHRRLQRLEG